MFSTNKHYIKMGPLTDVSTTLSNQNANKSGTKYVHTDHKNQHNNVYKDEHKNQHKQNSNK